MNIFPFFFSQSIVNMVNVQLNLVDNIINILLNFVFFLIRDGGNLHALG